MGPSKYQFIRHGAWAAAAAANRAVPLSATSQGDVLGAVAAGCWVAALLTVRGSTLVLLLVVLLGPFLASRYLGNRRLAGQVRSSRTGMEEVRDLRVELALQVSERVIAFETIASPVAVLMPGVGWILSAIIAAELASVLVHAELPPRRSLWSELAKQAAALFTAPAPVRV